MANETALERVKRILELIPYLHSRPESMANLAHEFDVPVAVITRDLEIAFMSGLPGYTPDLLIDISIESGLASVQEPQSLDVPPAMNASQMITLFLGLQLLLDLVNHGEMIRKTIVEMIDRIGALLGSNPIEDVKVLDFDSEKLVLDAIHHGRHLSFDYFSVTEKKASNRKVLPIELFWRSGQSLLNAAEIESGRVRSFFLSRMKNLSLGDGVDGTKRQVEAVSRPAIQAEIRLKADALWWTKRYAALIPRIAFDDQAQVLTVQLDFWEEEWVIRNLACVNDLVLSVAGITRYSERVREYLELTV